MNASPRQLKKAIFARSEPGLLRSGAAALGVVALSSALAGAARADLSDTGGGNAIVSSPLASEIAASSARSMNLASLLSFGKTPASGTVTVTTLSLNQRGGLGFAGTQAAGGTGAGGGISLFYYNSGSGVGSGLNGLMPSATAYGMVEHLSLLGVGGGSTTPAGGAGNARYGSLNLTGQFYQSNAKATPFSSLYQSNFGSNPALMQTTSGETNQAYDQHLAYAGKNVSLTASMSSIGKNFSDGGAFGAALASDDQATRDAANSLLNRRGQDEQTIGLSLGAARQTGQFTFNLDDLTDKLNTHKSRSQSLGYTWGDASKTQFTFQLSNAQDLIGHTHNNFQSFGLNQALGKQLSLQASHVVQDQGAKGCAAQTADNIHLSLAPDKKLALGLDATERITSDTFGSSDKALNLNVHRTLGGLTLGVIYGDEQRRSVYSAGGTAALASIRTMGFTASKQISKLFSVDTNWLMVDDSSQALGMRHLATETTHLNFTPLNGFALQDQYTTNAGVNSRLVSASYSLPKNAFAGLGFGPVTVSATDTEISGSDRYINQASTQTQKIALDTTLPRRVGLAGLFLPSFLSTDTALHVELGQARIDNFVNSGGTLAKGCDADVESMRLSGSLTAWKSAHWSYTFAAQTPTAATPQVKLPDAHEFDFSAPVSKLTLTAYDHDQVDQGGGNYKHATDRHVSLGGALTKNLNLAFDTGESRDYTLVTPGHTRMVGIHLSGKQGALQNLDFKVQRQIETEEHNGRNNATVYGLNFNLPQTTSRRLTLNCAVSDNKYINRPGATGKMDATVGFDFAQQF